MWSISLVLGGAGLLLFPRLWRPFERREDEGIGDEQNMAT